MFFNNLIRGKNQLRVAGNFISSKDVDKKCVMYTKGNKEFMTCDNANYIVHELFDKNLSRYQDNLEKRMVGSEFVFDLVKLLRYKCHKINFTRGGSYIDSPD